MVTDSRGQYTSKENFSRSGEDDRRDKGDLIIRIVLQPSEELRNAIDLIIVFDLINSAHLSEANDTYPPYDIVRTGSDSFRISLAVAGFAPENLKIVAQQNLLTVAGERSDGKDQEYLFKGISGRAFERKFSLADYVEVERARCENGLLQIDLVRRVPDAMKPRAIAIEAGSHQGSNVASLKAA
jgi:molecular chaperone IbpA